MLTHAQLWNALDRLAARAGLSASGLAKAAGLDPTTFNKSKRVTPAGRERWPSTESVARALAATNTSVDVFVQLVGEDGRSLARTLPLIGLAQAGGGTAPESQGSRTFDDAGIPIGESRSELPFPAIDDENAYALEISGNALEPVYRDGAVLIVSPNAPIRRGERVVVKTKDGKLTIAELKRRTSKTLELRAFGEDRGERTVAVREVLWAQRILWASQ
jgi:phage repressor protein C with HTH and peptisase S24 domain